jgi:hypothetical protein
MARLPRLPTLASQLSALAAFAALAGCSGPGGLDAPDDLLPGVRTETTVDDEFRCGALLFPQGCAIVRIGRVESGCAPEVGGYVLCNATIDWSADSGAVEPGSRLRTAVAGVEGPSCDPLPGQPCRVEGSANYTHHFTGPGEKDTWAIPFTAWLETPSGSSETSGDFALQLVMVVRTEGEGEITS